MAKTVTEFTTQLNVLLTARGFNITDADTPVLQYEVERAISEINKCRRFTATEEKPYDEKYESLVIPLCISAFAKMGAEGQIGHSENGVVRTYTSGGDYPRELLSGIVPLVK